ncbi:bifunctional precorrin-2 dehydrogenase/sirohydrochlorin ferrochelatase [Novosphingobium sp. AAP93]|uniref:precorrin-2 dehydrogenase/sirohydrochlorin ferrochelatase family protein n=1 Tax=Novosphingobium sp. AAP93 TaxID=1523427 RepID=UPI0006B904CF|nr:bifunctional precorrin-2 dehydrogenase/sirohydrochlorin ferrochelatase [Novosphingobium sp. AAP93]KPF89852.1 siroheme synthase [Novosphingobium sp. AAP93]
MTLPSLPLFHRLAGQPVVVLGHGEAAEAKRRLVLRAGGKVIEDLAEGIDMGARLAFIAHEDEAACQADAIRARGAGLLVNVVDKPALCDFTTPSIIDRAPVIVAVGTGGASAGLAKALRLRLERLLPQGLGALADALYAARGAMRSRWPTGPERRRALDAALEEGGALDPLREDGDVAAWVAGAAHGASGRFVIRLRSSDPDDLTLREARLLGQADAVIAGPDAPAAVLARVRADAARIKPGEAEPDGGIVVVIEAT